MIDIKTVPEIKGKKIKTNVVMQHHYTKFRTKQ